MRTLATGPKASRCCATTFPPRRSCAGSIEADDGRDERQVGVVDRHGGSASYTGPACLDWAGHRNGPGYAAQGNILVGAETVDALASTFEATAGRPLAERLIDCLAAAQAAGGDRRGQQSASLLIVERDGGYARLSDVVVDLRVDDHPRPVDELRRLHGAARPALRQDAARGLAAARGRAPHRGRRASRRTRLRVARRVGRRREPRGPRRGRERDRSGRARGAARSLRLTTVHSVCGRSPVEKWTTSPGLHSLA